MKVVRGIEEGRKALTREAFFEGQTGSPEVLEGIQRIFGQALTPEEVVGQIIAQVSRRGDDAVKEYTKLIDGVELTTLELDRDQEGFGRRCKTHRREGIPDSCRRHCCDEMERASRGVGDGMPQPLIHKIGRKPWRNYGKI